MSLANQIDYKDKCTSRKLEALRVDVFRGSTSSTEADKWISKVIECFRMIKCPKRPRSQTSRKHVGWRSKRLVERSSRIF